MPRQVRNVGFLGQVVHASVRRLPAVRADHQRADVDRLEIGQGDVRQTGEVIVIPAAVRGPDQSSRFAIVGQDDSVVPEAGDDDIRLRARGRARRSGD